MSEEMTEAKRVRGAFHILTAKGVGKTPNTMELPTDQPFMVFRLNDGSLAYTYNGMFHPIISQKDCCKLAKRDVFWCEFAYFVEKHGFMLLKDERTMLLLKYLGIANALTPETFASVMLETCVEQAVYRRGGTSEGWHDYKPAPFGSEDPVPPMTDIALFDGEDGVPRELSG